MVFAHDTVVALQAAVALANSALEPDTLTTVDELTGFLDTWEYTGRRDGTAAELAEVRALRPAVRELLLAERDPAAQLVNTMLADERAVPQLVRHGRHDWHIHAIAPDAALARRIVVETAMAMVDVIRTGETSRLGVCADDTCAGVVLDLSRNRSRRYCSAACGNRNAVAAYRARQRS
ncbi:CGNR zinc finger domain-containing protein [Isoptericola sp. b441]|uniref:CGNR zinc finger domain-containing protein n=1 Tax=Actinotalea lenta TaxID=3064654 RepID=A0ABT9D6Q0_9CELL|nr:CGNR zinc finger domain-containing protein [Isoptericola sp. b441]MDO8106056.1 CGNR zinc finger domain-containing protein [Isoptericola sp. b441]